MTTQEKSRNRPLGWEDCPGVVHGAWTFEDTRLPLYIVFENLAAGATIEEITSWFEGVTREQVKTVLSHVAHMLREDAATLEPEQS